MSSTARAVLGRLALPLLFSVVTGLVFAFAGDAYRTFGLAALDSSRRIVSHVLGIALFLSFGVLIDRIVRHLILDGLIARTLGTPVPGLLKQFSAMIIYLVIGAAILAVVFKQDLTVLWAASGVAGIVLGLALQTLLQDIYSGLALNIDRPLKIGDSIQIDGVGDVVKGEVKEISWRTTHIVDKTSNVIVLPNNKVAGATITNFSKARSHSVDYQEVAVDASVPHERALRILTAAVTEASTAFADESDPAPYVLVWSIAPHGVVYRVHYFCGLWQRDQAHTLTLQCILRHLRQAGLRPAAPKLEHAALATITGLGILPSQEEVVNVLAGSSLFAGLDRAALLVVSSKARLRPVPASTELVLAGETGSSAFVVIEGLLTATKRRSRQLGPVELLGPGDGFGSEPALLGDAHTATVRTRTPAIVCEIDGPSFQALFTERPDCVKALSRNLTKAAGTTAPGTDRDAAEGAGTALLADIERSIRRSFGGLLRRTEPVAGSSA